MKKLISVGLIGLLAFGMLGCTPAQIDNGDLSIDSTTSVEAGTKDKDTEEYYVSSTDDIEAGEVITIGDIMMFDGANIHIISGDLVEVFKYDNQNEEAFYIGQTVQLTKEANSNVLTHYEQEDYSISHTNMGHLIDQITGKLVGVDEESITVENLDGSFNIKTYEASNGAIGDAVTVYVMSFDETLSSIMILNENSKLDLKITEIARLENGAMLLSLVDSDDGEYRIDASYVSMELDMTQLAIDDTLIVYHKGIMESWPMQLDTVLIRK